MMISTRPPNRRGFLRLGSTIGVAAGLAASLSACGSDAVGYSAAAASTPAPDLTAVPDAEILAAISYELGNTGYDPMTTSSALTIAVNWHTMEGLTELHPATQEVYPALAASMPVQVNDTTYEVALRPGALFSNGAPVTADDVVFSFERVLNPANSSLYVQFLTFLASVTKKDDATVTIVTKHPFSLLAERLSVVKIVPRSVIESDHAGLFDANPVGTGPYRMTDNGAMSRTIVLERNDSYNGPRPALAKKMTWRIMPDDTERTEAITSGKVQVIDAVPVAGLTQIKDPVKLAAQQGFSLLFAMFNHASVADLRVRQAIMHAFDYTRICEEGMGTLATPATCFVDEGHPAYRAASTVYTYDVGRARALLSDAGVTSLTVLCTDHGWFSGAREIIKENLNALGVTVNVVDKKSSDAYDYIDNDKGAWDVLIAPGDPSVFGSDADLLMRWWYSADTWTDTRMHWKGTEAYTQVQGLLDQGVQLTDEAQIAKWQETFDVLAQEVPLYPIFHRKTASAYDSSTLVGYQPIALTGLSFVGVGSSRS